MPSDIVVPPEQSDAAGEQRRSSAISPIIRYMRRRSERSRFTSKTLVARIASLEFLGVVIAALTAKWICLDFYVGSARWVLPTMALGFFLGGVVYFSFNELNLYDPGAMGDPWIQLGKLLGGLTLSFLVVIGCLHLLDLVEGFSRGWMLLWFVMTVGVVCTIRRVAPSYVRSLRTTHRMQERFAIVGERKAVERLRSKLCQRTDVEVVVSCVDPLEFAESNGSSGRGLSMLIEQARTGEVDQIVIALPSLEYDQVKNALERLAILSINIYLWTDDTSTVAPMPGARKFGDVQLQPIAATPLAERAQLVKSGFDFIFSFAAILLLAPAFAIIALSVKLDSPGPVFFRQRRYGRNLKIFSICKFRTMTVMEDDASIRQVQRDDVRVTRVGRFLRRNSLDELPQLLNVLKGEMSLVGPRPHALVHDKLYAPQIEHYTWRHRVKPGMTGWAQVHGFRGETSSHDAMRTRMDYDLQYIDNWSIWLDFEILLRTIPCVLGKTGAY